MSALQQSMVMYSNIPLGQETVQITVDEITAIVCKYFDVTIEKVKAKTRKREIVLARQFAMYFTKLNTGMSLSDIGKYFGGRDHTTVIHSRETIKDLIAGNNEFVIKSYQDLSRHLETCITVASPCYQMPEPSKVITVSVPETVDPLLARKQRAVNFDQLMNFVKGKVVTMQRPAADHTNTHWEKKYAEV